ncbi:hypothetical protein FQR65_LT08186 [Abscondita terminalis]|nr:hypothetical protein FQR65_LT08186 [Abscondita terminalis]
MDTPKKKILSLTRLHFDVPEVNDVSDVIGEQTLDEFITTANILKIYATLVFETKNRIKFYFDAYHQYDKMLVVYKVKADKLTNENLSTIQVATVNGSPSVTLYHSLQNVFSPLFVKQERRSAGQLNIQRQLASLQAGLQSSLLSPDQYNLGDVDANTLNVILSLEHEVDYWTNVANISKNKEKQSSIIFRDILQPLARDFSVLDALPLSDIEDLLENAHNILDDLWHTDPPYPKIRMQNLMDLIATDIIKCVSKNLMGASVWTMQFNAVSELLQQSITVVNHWSSSCKQLTQIFWPNYSMHTWSGDPYVPQNLLNLSNRLKEILNIRTIHKQLVCLLTSSEEKELNTNAIFSPFEDLDMLECSSGTDFVWNTASKKYEFLLQPAEERVASKLKKQLSNTSINTRQLLYEFKRYIELINRPVVKKTLLSERQCLLTLLKDYVNQLNGQLSTEATNGLTKYDTPEVINEIMKVKHLESKTLEVKNVSETILDDLEGFEEVSITVEQLSKDIKQQHTELFDSWVNEVTSKIKDKTLSLQGTDQVVEFSKNKLMKVNYSPELVTLIQEVRQLMVLGYHIPSNIEDAANYAKKFMKHANILQQIANFHNTIGDRMIPSQRPMMLASALNLAKLVQEQEVVSWNNIDRVEQYIKNLQEAVEKLSSENNLLATYHFQIMNKISTLDDTDLIKYLHSWKETTRSIRDIILQVENKGFQSMRLWKVEIDQQLYKVLEKQYLKSLDTLHLYLPEIHADLIYRDSQLQLSPNANSLREKYHQQLKQFLDIPKTFRGVNSSEENIFVAIIENNPNDLEKVNKYADDLITQLDGVVKHWQSWLTLGTLDTSQLQSWEHWELHFRASKTFGQEIAKLPSTEERVGCFIIGLSWLRSDLESHNRSYWSLLTLSLKDSIAQDVFKLQQYVDTSTATLNKQPLTLDQIDETDSSYSDILNQKDQMETLYKDMLNKNQILGSWTRDRVDSVLRLKAAWERLQSLLDNYEHIIAKRMETMKITLKIAYENLQNDVERFGAKWEQTKFQSQSAETSGESVNFGKKHLQEIKEKREQLQELLARKEKVIADYGRFNLEPVEFSYLESLETDFKQEEDLWTCFEQFHIEFEKFGNEEWIVFRKKGYIFDEFLSNWQNKLEESKNNIVITLLLQEIQKYRAVMPVMKYVRGEDFTEKHWIEVFTLLGMVPKPIDILLLNDFLQVSQALLDNSEQLQIICKKAASEVVVRQAIAELDHWDVQCRFLFSEHKVVNEKKIFIIKDFKDILNKIGDNQSLLQSVKNSADYGSFSERAEMWESRLTDLEEHLTALAQIQRKWIYLEPIFGGGALGQEKSRFERLDKDFKHLLAYVERDPKVTSLNRYPNLKNTLANLQDQLSRCQSSLENFLEEKRNKFPRFLFLGDDDLLEIVGQCSKEQVIQSHLKKLFSGIHSINLDPDGKKIVAMCSLQGENVQLNKFVDINQPVENWLNTLVAEMQSSLKSLLLECLHEGDNADPLKYPSQILCLADNITFTSNCEQAIVNMALKPLLVNYKTRLNHYSSLNFNENTDNSLSSLDDQNSSLIEMKLKALILDTIHYITVIEELLKVNVLKLEDWNWQKQLRYYSDKIGNVKIKMVNAEMEYSFEYLGNQAKLVRTPLTDKCFLTLLQAMHLGMGGNPYGPAGTGKTESVKALGGLLGRQVLVFNCDEGIDSASMSKILSGLARCGAWGCFDEFNRLDEATLSAVSMYIQPIQNALRMNFNTLTLLDQEIELNKHCGIFITLNPAGGNYGGRNKLPDSLKQLFRPVVMSHPDQEQIATTLLYCDGYKHASLISQKLVEIFTSARKLLSSQQHYDWGLRSIKAVLSSCGQTIKNFYKSGANVDCETELQLAVTSLRVDTLSKLTYGDRIKFNALIQDVFPKTAVENFGEEIFITALKDTFAVLNLVENSRQIQKCTELHQQLQQRMGVVLVGPPNSGKSTLRNLLHNTLIRMGRNLKQYIFNPKSMPRVQLLGQIDADSRQWTDGVLTVYSLQAASESLDIHSWIVCDGDMDPDWVESLNSVLDDNKLLSLPSGWHIQFGPNSNFIFETHDLSHVSPATISRLGIIYLSEEDLDVSNVLTRFSSNVNRESAWENYGQEYFYKALEWIMNDADVLATTSQISVALTGLSQLADASTKTECFVGILNGLGGYLSLSSRQVFTETLSTWMGQMQPKTLFFYYNKDKDVVDLYENSDIRSALSSEYDIPLILTTQVQYTINCLKTWLTRGNEQHVLLIGPRGSAKSLILDYVVKERSDLELITIHCSANVSPQCVMQKLTQSCMIINSSKGRIYKPKKGHLVLYFKNTQLLKNDSWGSNMLISFLQQFISYNGLFDNNLEWIGVEHITIVCSTTNAGNLSPRFISTMRIFHINLPLDDDISKIYTIFLSSIITQHFEKIANWSNKKTSNVIQTLVDIHSAVQSNLGFLQEHYNFSLHELTKICMGLFYYKNEESLSENFMIEILIYETLGIYKDRLVNDEHRHQFQNILNDLMKTHWNNTSILNVFSDHLYAALSNASLLVKLNLEEWSDVIQKTIKQCEREGDTLDILLTSEMLQLTSKIGKALAKPGGSVLLVGTSGVGRKSSLKIIARLLSANLISLIFSNWSQFNVDLKMVKLKFGNLFLDYLYVYFQALQQAALEDKETYLLLEDNIFNNNIIDIVNALLCSGEVPGLYSTAELESLIVGLKDQMEQENYEGCLTDFFNKRVRRRLHLIVCLESDNSKFSEIIISCPALYNQCTVIWMSEWSTTTLDYVPQKLIEKWNSNEKTKKLEIAKGFSSIHNLAGVSKLTEARNVVAELKMKAKEQEEQLSQKQAKANTALDMISSTMKNANNQKNEMEKLKQQTEKESSHLSKRKMEIEEELKEVKPLIEEARAAISNIKSESLSEIRSLRAPPDVIRDILEGVLRLMGTQDTSWNSMKNFLSKRGVKEDIKSFDASRITGENREAVRKLISNRGDSFDPKNAKRASVAAAPLAAWVIANVRYSAVLENIKPLEREQNKLKQNLASAELQLHELSTGLVDVDTAVAKLKTQLSTYTKEAAEIEIHLRAAQSTITTAEGLVNKLNDEYERWKSQLKELSDEVESLPNNCLLAAAFITYLSSEPEDSRKFILDKWLEAMSVEAFSLVQFLSTEREQVQWQSEGLPADQLSLQNAIMIFNGSITPLLLDPTSIASNWIKTHSNSKTLEVTSQNSPKFSTVLELAIRFGKILIIEEVETVSPNLFTILRKQFIQQGQRKLINVNGKLIDYHDDFKLLLCCRNAHLQLPADIAAVVNVVNFTITPEGLSEQLLMSAIKQESPELEGRHKELLRQREELQEKQYNLQNQLLEDLANASGDILQNNNLMESLNETKASSVAITKALLESDSLQKVLQKEYNVYKDISSFASSLYFAIKEFSNSNVLYSLSVPAYIRLFLKSIPEMKDMDENFGFLRKTLIQSVYSYMSRSIFKMDRIKFALHLCHKILPQQIPLEEWNFFLGNSFLNKSDSDKNDNIPQWIADHSKPKILMLQYNLPKLYAKLQLDKESLWRKFLEIDECEVNFPPHCDLTEFQKVIIVQLLRNNRLYSAMHQCVLHLASLHSLNAEIIQLSTIYKETIASEPILFVTTPGTDPSIEIKEFANNKIGKENYTEISMGEGQETKALNAVSDAAKMANGWLWLITEPHKLFSPVLADCSLKIAYEVPPGVKNNLLRTYSSWGSAYVEKLNPNGARLFFLMACIHALLQERRTYIPQGWSKIYEFNDTDFSTAVHLTANLWQTNNVHIQWKFLKGICLDSVYGGRIENDQDLGILESYLTQYFVDESLSHRWRPFDLNTSLPTYSNFQEYLNVINQLSDRNLPQYFGLPMNIQKAWERTTSTNIILDLRKINLSEDASDKFSQEELYKKLTPFMMLWKKLNQGYDFIRTSTPTLSPQTSVFANFIYEEYYFAIALVKKIHKCFSILNRIAKSNVAADGKYLQLGHELIGHQTPKVWQGFWKGPEDPSNYLKSVISKTIEISTWNNNPDIFLKKPINLSLLFRAETFLYTFKQNFAQKTQTAMDDLLLKTNWKQPQDNDTITITSFFIEGALLEGNSLINCSTDSDSVNSAPNCHLSWIKKSEIESNEKVVKVPLFNSKNREEIVAHLQVSNHYQETNKWIQAGAAFFINY